MMCAEKKQVEFRENREMQITLEIKCPTCLSDSIKKNGIKVDGKQNDQCKDCKRQFIGDHALSYMLKNKSL